MSLISLLDFFHGQNIYSTNMVTENVVQCHIAGDEEEATAVMNWQSGDSNNNGSGNNGSYESPEDELGYLLLPRGRKGSEQ
jgi:murein tripeptide amidase MpaA